MKKFILFVLLLACCIMRGQVVFRHITVEGNISGYTTTLDHSLLNGHPHAIIFILPIWNNSGEAYDCNNYAQNVGVRYNGSRWTIVNMNKSVMLPSLTFNVLIAPENDVRCFSIPATRSNKSGLRSTLMVIDNPITYNKPNILLLVTQRDTIVTNDNSQLVSYANGKWYIGNNNLFYPPCKGYDKRELKVGAKFNVMVIENGIVPGFPQAIAFLHKATNVPPDANIEYINPHVSRFELATNSVFNTDPNTYLFATANWGWAQPDRPVDSPIGQQYTDSPLVGWQTRTNSKWSIVNATAVPFKEGTLINIVAIKP